MTIGVIVLSMVAIQVFRSVRRAAAADATVVAAAGYGTAGGFTTFVSNTAGPIMNTYLVRLGLDKHEMIGTSAWFYFVVNVTKVPIYLALGAWSAGGHFFTGESLAFDLTLVPMVVIGAYGGRRLFPHLPQQLFLGIVLVAVGGRRRQAAPAVNRRSPPRIASTPSSKSVTQRRASRPRRSASRSGRSHRPRHGSRSRGAAGS